MALLTPKGESNFPNLFKPSEFSEKFDMVLKVRPSEFDETDKKRWDQLLAEINKVATNEFGEDWKDIKDFHYPFKKGESGIKYFDDEDCYYVKLATKVRPSVVGPDMQNLGPGDFGRAICHVSYDPKAYEVKGKKGVNLYLGNVQKIKDAGVTARRPEEDFDIVEAEDDPSELFA